MSRLTVTELVSMVAEVLAEGFPDVTVEGEVSGFKAHSSGHWYFSLKDAGAVISCAMFRGDNQRVRRPPRDGDRVVLYGSLSVYPPRGTFSLVARRMEAAGAGDLQRRLEELRARLAAEGLFDRERKLPLPALPRAIAVVTSPTGAAFQDILRVVRQRYPGMPVYIAPCRVQGEGSAAEIVRAIALADAHGGADVIIVGRGGGSVEDLWVFNEEAVVRAVAACRTPIVSAVGHEVDVTLSDLAADVRAATPSHAAELVVPVAAELVATVDMFADRLTAAMERQVADRRERLRRIRLVHPRERVVRGRVRCDELDDRLLAAMRRGIAVRRERLGASARHLDALSPLSVLVRGYAIVTRGDGGAGIGEPVHDAAALAVGDSVRLRLAKGEADARIEAVRP